MNAPLRRRWFSFKLRTLLIFVTLVAMAAGWIAKERAISRRQLATIATIHQFDRVAIKSTLSSRFEDFDGPTEDYSWLRQSWLDLLGPRVTRVEVESSVTSGSTLPISALAELTDIDFLQIYNCDIDDLAPLARFSKLEYLAIRDLWSKALYTERARQLTFDRNQYSSLAPLAGLTRLRYFQIDCPHISDLSPLAQLSHLQDISLSSAKISDLRPLAGLSDLERLYLEDNPIRDLTPLAKLTKLQVLNLSDTKVDDIGPLAGLANLNDLMLRETEVHDLSPLFKLHNLKSIDLQGTHFSLEELKQLRTALPKCWIVSDFGNKLPRPTDE